MRELTEHQTNTASQLLTVTAQEDHPSGVPHVYVTYPHGGPVTTINFQDGPIQSVGCNGLTHEALLAVVLDRLRAFQKGPYFCRENALAITKIEEGLMWLNKRTVGRMQRGVEGTHRV